MPNSRTPPAGIPTEADLLRGIAADMRAMRDNPQHPLLVGKPDGNPVQIRPPMPAPTDMTARWQQGVTNNAQRWVEGVQRPRANFKVEAIRNNAGWKTGVTAAVQADSFVKAMGQVQEDEAIATAVAVGADGFVRGANARAAKHTRKMERLVPAMASAITQVRGMPSATEGDREARAVAMIRGARAAGKAARGG